MNVAWLIFLVVAGVFFEEPERGPPPPPECAAARSLMPKFSSGWPCLPGVRQSSVTLQSKALLACSFWFQSVCADLYQ